MHIEHEKKHSFPKQLKRLFIPAIATDKKHILNTITFLALLASTLFVHSKVPFLKYAIYNYLLPVFALLLVVLNLGQLQSTLKYHRKSLFFMITLYFWMWISTFVSDFQEISIKYSIKFTIYLIIFIAFLLLTHHKQRQTQYYLYASRFLGFLAIFGLIEYFFPATRIFYFFRPQESLNAYPHISSLMQWPNQFGVLMSIWALLTIILYRQKAISSTEFYLSSAICLIIIPLSGSTNAWFVVLAGIGLAFIYKTIRFSEVLIFVGLLSLSILFFPVSASELGIRKNEFSSQKNTSTILPDNKDGAIHAPSKDTNLYSRKSKFPRSSSLGQQQQEKTKEMSAIPEMTYNWGNNDNTFKKTLFDSLNSRLSFWKAAARITIDNPVTGIGIQSFTQILVLDWRGGFNTHNMILNILVELGIPGLILSILFFYSLLKKAQWDNPIIIIPVIMVIVGQQIDYFNYDFTFTTFSIYLIAESGNSKSSGLS